MTLPLTNRRVAILATHGFEQSELESPFRALCAAGAVVQIVSPQAGQIQGMHHADKGDLFDVDLTLADATPDAFDALLLPGGLANPDTLRALPDAVRFVSAFVHAGKPIAAICHGPWLLIEADAIDGRKLTSWPAIQTDVRNAGGDWVDEEVVRDGWFVTSRSPDDLPAFNRAMIEMFGEYPPGGEADTLLQHLPTSEEVAFQPALHTDLGVLAKV